MVGLTEIPLIRKRNTGERDAISSNLITKYAKRLELEDGTYEDPSLAFEEATGTGLFNDSGGLGVSSSGTQVATFENDGLQLIPGTAGSPALTCMTDDDTGAYFDTNALRFSVNGTNTASVIPAGLSIPVGSVSAPSLSFAGNANYGLYHASGNVNVANNGSQQLSVTSAGISSSKLKGISSSLTLADSTEASTVAVSASNIVLTRGNTDVTINNTSYDQRYLGNSVFNVGSSGVSTPGLTLNGVVVSGYTPSLMNFCEETTATVSLINSNGSGAITSLTFRIFAMGSSNRRVVTVTYPAVTFDFSSLNGYFTSAAGSWPTRFRINNSIQGTEVNVTVPCSISTRVAFFRIKDDGKIEFQNSLSTFTASVTLYSGCATYLIASS